VFLRINETKVCFYILYFTVDTDYTHIHRLTLTLLIIKHKSLWCNKTWPSDQQRFWHVKKKKKI